MGPVRGYCDLPLRRKPVLVDLFKGRNVKSDKPHRSSVEAVVESLAKRYTPWFSFKNLCEQTYLETAQPIVWTRQPCVSWIWRDFQRVIGATIQAQANCQTIVGHLLIDFVNEHALGIGFFPLLFSPFPALTHLGLLLHRATVDFSAGNTPRTVPFARNDVHQAGEEDLEDMSDEKRFQKVYSGKSEHQRT